MRRTFDPRAAFDLFCEELTEGASPTMANRYRAVVQAMSVRAPTTSRNVVPGTGSAGASTLLSRLDEFLVALLEDDSHQAQELLPTANAMHEKFGRWLGAEGYLDDEHHV